MIPATNSRGRKNTFNIEEPSTKRRIWYQWFNIRLRQYMIPEVFFLIFLIMIYYRLQTISNQNDRILEVVNSMQSQLGNIERKIELLFSRKPNQDISQLDNSKPLEKSTVDGLKDIKLPTQDSADKTELRQEDTHKIEPAAPQTNRAISKTEDSTSEISESQFDNTKPLETSTVDGLKNMEVPTQDSKEKTEPIRDKKTELIQESTDEIETTAPQTNQAISKTEDSTSEISESKEQFLFNAADYLMGAHVDNYRSSSSNLNRGNGFGYDQTDLVLLDRPEPPADKAWCSNSENPVLTIKLAKYIKPISVSYQHSKWHGAIPNGAPKTYDVVACLDCNEEKWEPLALNCQYSQYETNGKEQMCDISSHFDLPLIREVQFRFRKNYGDTNRTCVNLVRVYGETDPPVIIEDKPLNSGETCADLRWYYYNNYLRYILSEKNCDVLYQNNCCTECPECCQKCLIRDYDKTFIVAIFLCILFPSLVFLFICYVILFAPRRNNQN